MADEFLAWVAGGFPDGDEDTIDEFLTCDVWELDDDARVKIERQLIAAVDHEIDTGPDHLFYACATDAVFTHIVTTYGESHDVVGLMTGAADGPENLELVIEMLVRLDLHLPKRYEEEHFAVEDEDDHWLTCIRGMREYLIRGAALRVIAAEKAKAPPEQA